MVLGTGISKDSNLKCRLDRHLEVSGVPDHPPLKVCGIILDGLLASLSKKCATMPARVDLNPAIEYDVDSKD